MRRQKCKLSHYIWTYADREQLEHLRLPTDMFCFINKGQLWAVSAGAATSAVTGANLCASTSVAFFSALIPGIRQSFIVSVAVWQLAILPRLHPRLSNVTDGLNHAYNSK